MILNKDVNEQAVSGALEEERDVTEWMVAAENARERIDKYIRESWEEEVSLAGSAVDQRWSCDGERRSGQS